MLKTFLRSQFSKSIPSLIFTVGKRFGVRSFSTGSVSQSGVKVFHRRSKLLQRERAAASSDVDNYDFMKDEVGYRHQAWPVTGVLLVCCDRD